MVAADGTKLSAASAEALMEQRLGWHLPLAGFNTWVKGVALPSSRAKVERDAVEHTIVSLEQNNWLIKYGAYTGVDVGSQSKLVYLPTKLEFVRDKIKIKLLVKSWDVR
jgi:outer membrane lipoprotein LolB